MEASMMLSLLSIQGLVLKCLKVVMEYQKKFSIQGTLGEMVQNMMQRQIDWLKCLVKTLLNLLKEPVPKFLMRRQSRFTETILLETLRRQPCWVI